MAGGGHEEDWWAFAVVYQKKAANITTKARAISVSPSTNTGLCHQVVALVAVMPSFLKANARLFLNHRKGNMTKTSARRALDSV